MHTDRVNDIVQKIFSQLFIKSILMADSMNSAVSVRGGAPSWLYYFLCTSQQYVSCLGTDKAEHLSSTQVVFVYSLFVICFL